MLPAGLLLSLFLIFYWGELRPFESSLLWLLSGALVLIGAGGLLVEHEDDLDKRLFVTIDFVRQTLVVLIIVTVVLALLVFWLSDVKSGDLLNISSNPSVKTRISKVLASSSEVIAATIGAAITFGGALVAITLATQGLRASKEQHSARLQTFIEKLVDTAKENIIGLEQVLMDLKADTANFWDEVDKLAEAEQKQKFGSVKNYDEFVSIGYRVAAEQEFTFKFFHQSLISTLNNLSTRLHRISNDPVLSSAWGKTFYRNLALEFDDEKKIDTAFILEKSFFTAFNLQESNNDYKEYDSKARFTTALVRLAATFRARVNLFTTLSNVNDDGSLTKANRKKTAIESYTREIFRIINSLDKPEDYAEFPRALILGYYLSPAQESREAIENIGITNVLKQARQKHSPNSNDQHLNVGLFLLEHLLKNFPLVSDFKEALENEFQKVGKGLEKARIDELSANNAGQLAVLGSAIKDLAAEVSRVSEHFISIISKTHDFQTNLFSETKYENLDVEEQKLFCILDFDDSRYSSRYSEVEPTGIKKPQGGGNESLMNTRE
jgi:archaellum component FlaC